jgi:hypothetical protein
MGFWYPRCDHEPGLKNSQPLAGGELILSIAFQKFAMFIYIKKFSQSFKLWVMMERQIKADKLHI